MKINQILCWAALGVSAILALVFLADLIVGMPFERFSVMTDLFIIVASGLIIWQSVETLQESK